MTEDKPIVWRNIERVPFAHWTDFIEDENEGKQNERK